MQSVTAYYVIAALDQAREASAVARARSAPTRPSRLAALVAVVTRSIRRPVASPA
jgi:hypothetical protein